MHPLDHPDADVGAAFVRLLDALTRWERTTGRKSGLVFREAGGFTIRAQDGKLGVPDYVTDETLLASVEDGGDAANTHGGL